MPTYKNQEKNREKRHSKQISNPWPLPTTQFVVCVTEIRYGVTKTCLIICGNKMPTRCNRSFYCRSYCLLNMFRASPCPSSGAQEYYTVVAACITGRITLSPKPDQLLEKPQHKITHAATTV